MPLSTSLKTFYPGAIQLSLYTTKPTNWGRTIRTLYTDASMLINIHLGARSGFSPAIASHEAAHAMKYIMQHTDYRTYAPAWNCTYHREETECALVESIVRGSMAFAIENKIRLSNPPRNLSGMIISQQPKENEDEQRS